MNMQQEPPHGFTVSETSAETPRRQVEGAPRALFLTTRQAAALLAVTPHRLATLRMEHRGPIYYRTPTGTAVYYRNDVLTWHTAAQVGRTPREPSPIHASSVHSAAVADSRQ